MDMLRKYCIMRLFYLRRNKHKILTLISILLLGFILTSWKTGSRMLEKELLIQEHLAKNEWLLHTDVQNLIGTRNQTCVHPNMPLWNKEIEKYIEIAEPVKCADENDWVYTKNGKFYISLAAEKKHGKLKCKYEPIFSADEDFVVGESYFPMLNGSKLLSDAFKVSCIAADGYKYSNTHACIAQQSPRIPVKMSSSSENFNVLILGLDSLSRQMFMRLLPKTHKYFTEVLDGSLLEGFNIVGDGTTQALMPMLTGKRETEIPETRRGRPGAKPVDELLEFIWTKYEKKGYVTQWAEDLPQFGSFSLRLLGFKNQPVIHYMRPFYLATARKENIFTLLFRENRHCLGSRMSYSVYLDWIKEAIETNKGRNFFSFGFISDYSHNNNKDVTLTDQHNVEFLKYLKSHSILDNTFLILMGDHGLRYGPFRMTEQGKLEERMPYFGLFVPTQFREKFPSKYRNFVANTGRLVVPSDIHETFLDIINEKSDYKKAGINRSIYSLFTPIPETRTCSDAGVEPHWCACLKADTVSISDPTVKTATLKIVSFINDLMQDFSTMCHKLTLSKIIKAASLGTDDNVLKFKQSADRDGRVADLGDTTRAERVHYLITFVTLPGSGVFEASVSMDVKTGNIEAREKQISRLNAYNDAPKCIEDSQPQLRPYCVCR